MKVKLCKKCRDKINRYKRLNYKSELRRLRYLKHKRTQNENKNSTN
jgi:hypothetical protein